MYGKRDLQYRYSDVSKIEVQMFGYKCKMFLLNFVYIKYM